MGKEEVREVAKVIASVIAQPEEGLLHVSHGHPCENPYVTYRLDEPPETAMP
jgi:hypothetical protein